MARIKAKILQAGDTVGIIAPSSPPRSLERVEKAVAYFERNGYRVELAKHLMDAASLPSLAYLAASDKDRVSDLHAMFRNKKVKAIFMIRGGYGTIRMLDKIDYSIIANNPKIIVGYSDATALFNAIYKKTGLASCFFGPMPGVDMWDTFDPFAEEIFWRSMTSASPFGPLPLDETEGQLLFEGASEVTGRLLGGNLTVFNSLLGTPYQPNFKNTIAFFEEIDEKPRKIDAMLAQLRHAGLWEKTNAILLGQFTGCVDNDAPSLSLETIFAEYFGKLKKPVVQNLPWGHVPQQWTVPLGAMMSISANKKGALVSLLESGLVI